MSNFIDHKDPTKPIDNDLPGMEQLAGNLYNSLSEEEKIIIGAKLLGMNHVPVDIHTFLQDDYFLGNELITNKGKSIFDYWNDKYDTIFPNPILNKYPYLSFSGCVGSGKSFASKIIGLYNYHKLDCCTNVYKSIGLAGGTKLAFGFFHANFETAKKDFVDFFKLVFDISPYFRKQYNQPPIRLIASGPQSTGAVLGSQLVFSVLSEIGFWRPQDAKNKMDEVLTRYNSRFANKRFWFGGVIADSSAKDSDHGATQRFEEIVPKNELYTLSPSQWEARPELYEESNGKTFRMYKGDSRQLPRVVEDDEDIIKLGMDPGRIINVPISAKHLFLANPIRNLQDLAGVPYTGQDLFFAGDLSHVLKCSSIRNLAPETVVVDFYNKEDRIFDKVQSMIWRIPKGTHLMVHYDIGLRKDITGICLCYYNGEKQVGNSSLPCFRIPLIFGVSRIKGQSTSLDHLYGFITDLIKNGYTVTFSADSFASAGLFQSLERDGVDYKSISIDKTMDAGIMLKNIINSDRLEMPYHNTFLRECSEIKVVTNGVGNQHIKLDHPAVSNCTDFDYKDKNNSGSLPGTKDLFDAACGAVYSCYLKYSEYLEGGMAAGVNMTMRATENMTKDAREETQKTFQSMLENLF